MIQALQIYYPTCIIPPIPPKINLSQYYEDESTEINERKEGLQRFLDALLSNKILCGSEDLKSLLTDPADEFNHRKGETMRDLKNDELNVVLSTVLSDGSAQLEQVVDEKTYYGQTVKVVK